MGVRINQELAGCAYGKGHCREVERGELIYGEIEKGLQRF